MIQDSVEGGTEFRTDLYCAWSSSLTRNCHFFVTKRMGGSCAQVGKPGVKESGTPEDVPRTAAITQNCGHKKTPANLMGALLRSTLGLPSPVAELAATAEGYRAG